MEEDGRRSARLAPSLPLSRARDVQGKCSWFNAGAFALESELVSLTCFPVYIKYKCKYKIVPEPLVALSIG